ncbi:MAG: hypothetical protein OER86_00450 [Phycisphaerae bacterium]|nr:hypothetical protein [Phycisphaerae bacterium]
MPIRLAILITLLVPSLLLAQAAASPEQKFFNDLFGARVKAARTSEQKLDVANEMLAAANKAVDELKILTILCNQTHDLCSGFRDGYATAAAAMELLAKHVQDERDSAMTRLLAIRLKQYSVAARAKKAEAGEQYITTLIAAAEARTDAGALAEAVGLYGRARTTARTIRSDQLEQIQGMYNWSVGQQKLAQQIKALKGQLKANPKNTPLAKTLLSLLIGEANQPTEARKYSFLADDELKPIVKLALIEKRAPDQSLTLARWYQNRARLAEKPYKADLLTRARGGIEDYLDRGPSEGPQRAIASLQLRAINQELDKLADSGPRPRKTTIQFVADKSMKLFPIGTSQSGFPPQETIDPRGPFLGKGIFFRQNNHRDTDIYYTISSAKQVKEIYYKGAATRRFKMEILDSKGRVIATMSSQGKGNVWDEYTLKVPAKAGRKFVLHFQNVISTWFYINKIELR